MKNLEKAIRSFNYQCKLASNCRHDKYMISCCSCPDEKVCYIQNAIETARIQMNKIKVYPLPF